MQKNQKNPTRSETATSEQGKEQIKRIIEAAEKVERRLKLQKKKKNA